MGCLGGRNKRIYDNSTISPQTSIENALAYQGLFNEGRVINPCTFGNLGCWQPLDTGLCKLNIDEALFSDLKMASIGSILRDSHTKVLFAASMKELDI